MQLYTVEPLFSKNYIVLLVILFDIFSFDVLIIIFFFD